MLYLLLFFSHLLALLDTNLCRMFILLLWCSPLLLFFLPVGATPLMVACSGGHLDIAQLLLHSGAGINSQTPEGWAALHVAVWACAPGVARLLLRSGAQPNVK